MYDKLGGGQGKLDPNTSHSITSSRGSNETATGQPVLRHPSEESSHVGAPGRRESEVPSRSCKENLQAFREARVEDGLYQHHECMDSHAS